MRVSELQVVGQTGNQTSGGGPSGSEGGGCPAAASIAAAEAEAVLCALQPTPRAALEAGRAAVRALGLQTAGLGSVFDGLWRAGTAALGAAGSSPTAGCASCIHTTPQTADVADVCLM
jgi:hypothetical protein